MGNLFQILNQFVMVFRKNVINKRNCSMTSRYPKKSKFLKKLVTLIFLGRNFLWHLYRKKNGSIILRLEITAHISTFWKCSGTWNRFKEIRCF
jgi:hypothetical protein